MTTVDRKEAVAALGRVRKGVSTVETERSTEMEMHYNIVGTDANGERIVLASYTDLSTAREQAANAPQRREQRVVLYQAQSPTDVNGSQRGIYDRLLAEGVSASRRYLPDAGMHGYLDGPRVDAFDVVVDQDYRDMGGDVELEIHCANMSPDRFGDDPEKMTPGVWTNLKLTAGVESLTALIAVLTEARDVLYRDADAAEKAES